jgi:eukaryotic-like serine/threonine-protein kinase
MGRVLLGVDDGDRRAALRVVHPQLAAQPGFRERFRREVQLAATAPPWFSAAVLDADPGGDPPWLATAYVEGPTLQAYVEGNGPLSRQGTVALAIRMADGLVALHGAGLVHGDLRPSNVVLAEDGPRLTDFGVARAAEPPAGVPRTGHVIAGPDFLSPEQVAGHRDAGPAADIFSFGSLIGFAATGRSPFAADSVPGVVHRISHTAPDLGPVDGPLREAVLACLTKDPATRPTAARLRDLLRLLEQPEPAAAPAAVAAPAGPSRVPAARAPVPPVPAPAGPPPAVSVPAPAPPPSPVPVPAPAGPASAPARPAPTPGGPAPTRAGAAPVPPSPVPLGAIPVPRTPDRSGPSTFVGAPVLLPERPARGLGSLTRRQWGIIAAVVIAALAGAGIALAAVFTVGGGDAAAPAAEGPNSTASAAPSVDSAGSSDQDVTVIDGETDQRFGTGSAQFVTPSRNIACRMSTGDVRCDVAQRTWEVPPPPADCTQSYGTGAILAGSGKGQLSCVGDTLADSSLSVLDYGQGVRFGDVVCVSKESGMRCENSRTGHGFNVARAAYDLF